MKMIRILFKDRIPPDESREFNYLPVPSDEKAVGLLVSNGVAELSLGFDNGTRLSFHKLGHTVFPRFSPDRQIIKLEEPLNGKMIKGLVKAGNNEAVSIYLITKTKDHADQ